MSKSAGVAAASRQAPKAPVDSILKEIAPKKQSLLTSFLRDTAVITDELAAKAMRQAKAEKRKAEKKATTLDGKSSKV